MHRRSHRHGPLVVAVSLIGTLAAAYAVAGSDAEHRIKGKILTIDVAKKTFTVQTDLEKPREMMFMALENVPKSKERTVLMVGSDDGQWSDIKREMRVTIHYRAEFGWRDEDKNKTHVHPVVRVNMPQRQ